MWTTGLSMSVYHPPLHQHGYPTESDYPIHFPQSWTFMENESVPQGEPVEVNRMSRSFFLKCAPKCFLTTVQTVTCSEMSYVVENGSAHPIHLFVLAFHVDQDVKEKEQTPTPKFPKR